MYPLIIIPDEKEEITLKTSVLRKYISDAYYNGYSDGCEKGKYEQIIEASKPKPVYRSEENPDFLNIKENKYDVQRG